MSNSIEHNRRRTDNSMPGLSFHWMAEFKASVIFQYENGQENRFQKVLDRFNELEFFHLYNKTHRFVVDLKKGIIRYNNSKTIIDSKEIKNNIRLIHFRRHTVQIGEKDLKEQSHNIEYHLGLQWNDQSSNNHKIILIIDEQGNFIIEG